jgi:dienelactone hydrolase
MQKTSIRENNLIADIYTPELSGNDQAVLLVSGSDGGIPGNNAVPRKFVENLVSQGYTVLALAYFGVDPLPAYLENIHFEYFLNAIAHFKNLGIIADNKLGIMGVSRGGELCLLLGAYFPELFNFIVSYVPSSVICGGFPYFNRPAWYHNHQVIGPFLGGFINNHVDLSEAEDLALACKNNLIPWHSGTREDPYIALDLRMMKHTKANLADFMIPVEKITCPLLVFSGGEDKVLPSTLYSEMITRRLQACASTIKYQHKDFTKAGHGLMGAVSGSIFHPRGKFWCTMGGTYADNLAAYQDGLQILLEFLANL